MAGESGARGNVADPRDEDALFHAMERVLAEPELAHAQAAQVEVAVDRARAAAHLAAVDDAGRELCRAIHFRPLGCTSHFPFSS